jgi:hypothetical protein
MAFGLFKKSGNPPAGRQGKEEHGQHYFNLKVKEIIPETRDSITIRV